MTDLADLPVRMLIAQLAQIEDAIRTTPTFTTATDGPAPLNGDLLALLARERDIIAELRRPADPIERTREPRAARISNAHAWRDVSPTRAEGPEVWPDLEVKGYRPYGGTSRSFAISHDGDASASATSTVDWAPCPACCPSDVTRACAELRRHQGGWRTQPPSVRDEIRREAHRADRLQLLDLDLIESRLTLPRRGLDQSQHRLRMRGVRILVVGLSHKQVQQPSRRTRLEPLGDPQRPTLLSGTQRGPHHPQHPTGRRRLDPLRPELRQQLVTDPLGAPLGVCDVARQPGGQLLLITETAPLTLAVGSPRVGPRGAQGGL